MCKGRPDRRAIDERQEGKRPSRLVMHRAEIDRLAGCMERDGLAIPALRLYWKEGRVKVVLGLGKGKQAVDKRMDLKKRVENREAERAVSSFNRKHG